MNRLIVMCHTANPLSLTTAPRSPLDLMRLPRARQRGPIFGLSRSFLNELILGCPKNQHRPPVRPVVLRRRGARTGVRLIDFDSLRAYSAQNVEPTYKPNHLGSTESQ